MQVKKQQLEPYIENWPVQNWERSTTRLLLSPFLFNLHTEHIMRNARLDEIARRNNKLRYADDTTLMAESQEELNSLNWKELKWMHDRFPLLGL